ncbi:MAG: serine/threonine protein kinase [Lentisphaerae bacterium]|nr:serine/threonine protein kinase [Lentisphaerota bacterium]
MIDSAESSVPDQTIPGSADSAAVADFRALREQFGIFPCEDGSEYRDLKLLGMGGMGVVFSGEDPTLQRHVAVKILREPYRCNRELIAKFVNEARITARIDHPNIVAVHQLGVNEHQGVYFSMRRISGETLQTVIRRLQNGDTEAGKNYTLRRLLDIFIAGCNAVAAAHDKQILHCDLKPANIMIGAFGEVLVLDWGLAREIGVPAEKKKDVISGTPVFMAPELLSGERSEPDVQTDVYALGTILYSILTRRSAPFDMSRDKEDLLSRIASGRHLPLRAPKGQHIPRELAAICRKAMAFDRSERYTSVSGLLQDLYDFRDGRAVKAYSPDIIYRFFKLCRRHPAIPIAVMVALMTLLVHRMAVGILEFAHDRSLLRSAGINLVIADDNHRRSAAQLRLEDNETLSDPLKAALREKNILLQANLALMEYFSVLDSMSGLSDAGAGRFSREFAPGIYKHILGLASGVLRDEKKVREVLERCRRLDFFDEACRNDERLAAQVRRIDGNTGLLTLDCGDTSRHGKLFYPDGTEKELQISGVWRAALPAGKYRLEMDDDTVLQLLVIPGGDEKLSISPAPEDISCRLIPADHYLLPIPDSAPVRCDLAGFCLAGPLVPVAVSYAEAEKFARDFPGAWHLPYPVELQKAWSTGPDGKTFYRTIPAAEMVWLKNGMLYDPVSRSVSRAVPGQRGLVYLTKSTERR